jgi:hypothetical protein
MGKINNALIELFVCGNTGPIPEDSGQYALKKLCDAARLNNLLRSTEPKKAPTPHYGIRWDEWEPHLGS